MIMTKSFAQKLSLCLVVGWMVQTPALAVENGRPDVAHQNVGLLAIDFDGPNNPFPPFGLCSGFVISDSAFATAAHCINVSPNAHFAVSLEAGSPENPLAENTPGIFNLLEFNITDFPLIIDVIYADAVHYHPDYNGDSSLDVAVLEFPSGTFDVAPVRLPEEGFLNQPQAQRALENAPITLVGYGASERISAVEFLLHGYRKWGLSSALLIDETWIDILPSEVFNAAPLLGDSGSPQFIFGRAVSLNTDFLYLRLDRPVVRDFLMLFVD